MLAIGEVFVALQDHDRAFQRLHMAYEDRRHRLICLTSDPATRVRLSSSPVQSQRWEHQTDRIKILVHQVGIHASGLKSNGGVQ